MLAVPVPVVGVGVRLWRGLREEEALRRDDAEDEDENGAPVGRAALLTRRPGESARAGAPPPHHWLTEIFLLSSVTEKMAVKTILLWYITIPSAACGHARRALGASGPRASAGGASRGHLQVVIADIDGDVCDEVEESGHGELGPLLRPLAEVAADLLHHLAEAAALDGEEHDRDGQLERDLLKQDGDCRVVRLHARLRVAHQQRGGGVLRHKRGEGHPAGEADHGGKSAVDVLRWKYCGLAARGGERRAAA